MSTPQTSPAPLTIDRLRTLPKVSLHDHLDGGLRPSTIVEIASANGHQLPTTDPAELGAWFRDAADSGSLVRYLETFDHTVAVMQDAESLARVATEAVLDLAADGVVYGELRYAPEQHLQGGLTLDEVVVAVEEGMRRGEQLAVEAGTPICVGTLVTAMRHADRSREIADLALRHRDAGVVGFDIAGAEIGFPPSNHRAAFDQLHAENFPVTIHAGEAEGLVSIADALHTCGAERIGHGVRIVEDIEFGEGRDRFGMPNATLGRLATWVRDRGIVLELCPSSNVQTGAATDVATHPVTALKDLGFSISVNTDNRLMSGTSLSREFSLLVDQAHWTLADVERATITALSASFLPFPERLAIASDVVRPAYAS